MHPTFVPSVRLGRLLLALAGVAAIAACIDWSRATAAEPIDIRRYIFGVETTTGIKADFVAGVAPAASDGPALSANVPAIVLKGGTSKVTFSSVDEFSRLVVAVDGVPGYFELTLDAPATSVDVFIIYAQDVVVPAFWLQYAAGSGVGLGPFSASNTAFLGNATGPIQVNITWDSPADVDLYVVDPRGNEIYYNNRGPLQGASDLPGPLTDPSAPGGTPGTRPTSGLVPVGSSGGVLDIDSNAACFGDGPRAENIVWPTRVVPPHGEYTVRVNYWSSCGAVGTNYVITVRVAGSAPVTVSGFLDGPGVGGASGAGRIVKRFRY